MEIEINEARQVAYAIFNYVDEEVHKTEADDTSLFDKTECREVIFKIYAIDLLMVQTVKDLVRCLGDIYSSLRKVELNDLEHPIVKQLVEFAMRSL